MSHSRWIVVMGVSGSGKSSLAAALASQTGTPLIEGDDFHSAASREKMRLGTSLNDGDRKDWLDRLGRELSRREQGAVLACSALKLAYRDQLRAAVPRLKFVFIAISRESAKARVAARHAVHLFPPSLVDSQFETLEVPDGEPDVLQVSAAEALPQATLRVIAWLNASRS